MSERELYRRVLWVVVKTRKALYECSPFAIMANGLHQSIFKDIKLPTRHLTSCYCKTMDAQLNTSALTT